MTLMSVTFPLKVMLLKVMFSSSKPRLSKLEAAEDWIASFKTIVVLVVVVLVVAVVDVDGLWDVEAELGSAAFSSVVALIASASFSGTGEAVAVAEVELDVVGFDVVEGFVETFLLP